MSVKFQCVSMMTASKSVRKGQESIEVPVTSDNMLNFYGNVTCEHRVNRHFDQ